MGYNLSHRPRLLRSDPNGVSVGSELIHRIDGLIGVSTIRRNTLHRSCKDLLETAPLPRLALSILPKARFKGKLILFKDQR